MAEGEKSTLDLLFTEALSETDSVLVNVGGTKTQQSRIAVLRAILNAFSQDFSGPVTAPSFAGNGKLLTELLFTGVGGTSSIGSLSLVCNSDGSTPLAKIVWSKDGVDIGSFDENGFSPATDIPYSHADDAIPFAKDLNLNGFNLLRSRTIQSIQPFQYARFNGATSEGIIPDNDNIDGGKNDLSILIEFNSSFDFSGGSGYLFDKRIGSSLGFNCPLVPSGNLSFNLDYGSSKAVTTVSRVDDGKNHIAIIRLDRSGNMDIYLDGLLDSPLVDISAGADFSISNTQGLYLGSNSGASFYTGVISRFVMFNRLLTSEEAKSLSSNPNKAIDWADEGGSNTDLTSGTVTIGKNYRTTDFIAGDDFTNVSSVGASANVDGAEWTAIDTTPTTWTNSSVLHRTGATLNLKPQDIITAINVSGLPEAEFWMDSSGNGNHAVLTDVSVGNISRQLVERRDFIIAILLTGTSGTITLDNTQETLGIFREGSKVTIGGEILVDSVSSPVGTLRLGTLPFLNYDSGVESTEVTTFDITFENLATGVTGTVKGVLLPGGNEIIIRDDYNTTSAAADDTFANHIQAGSKLKISGSYYTNE